ncbi:MAG TPA: uroporphyrinogen decarboxylase family protein [Candidatus Brocadiia bacterium]|nr:uroporphyrinogen decarboxylase family protein [Candidatus Brocadiia bacterium]
MKARERIFRALGFEAPDRLPVRIYAAPGGLYEHGQKLVDLIKACGHDFGDLSGLKLPNPPGPEAFDADGRYHEFKTDEWGIRWEYRIFGIWGHPVEWPLNDWANLETYRMPDPPRPDAATIEKQRMELSRQKEEYFCLGGGGSIFERLHSLRRFEDTLMDIGTDAPEINRLADRLVEHFSHHVAHSLAVGVDGIAFGDDFGTGTAMIMSPAAWKRFFMPRFDTLFDPIRKAGKPIFFHSCGQISPIIPELRKIGVSAIWPQLPAYDLGELAAICRDLGLAVELHPDRGELMQRATPEQVRRYVHDLLGTFRTLEGGSWLYIEIDPGFPWENVRALIETAMEFRRTR